jgi:hypothetical protein
MEIVYLGATGELMKTLCRIFGLITAGIVGIRMVWGADMPIDRSILPNQLGVWVRADSTQRVDRETIFDYMDGAGELYLGYRFDSLQVDRYTAGSDEILVEIYYMASPDDAFGLLSLDWSGEAIDLGERSPAADGFPDFPNALYGTGLLRLWADRFYARVFAYRETEEARAAILELGRWIARGRSAPPPAMLSLAQTPSGSSWQPQWQQASFLRSHLVLNSLYYLAGGNLLQLDQETAALFVHYVPADDAQAGRFIRCMIIDYRQEERARNALRNFILQFLPDQKPQSEEKSFHLLEEGWMGYQRLGRFLLLILSCPDEGAGEELLDEIRQTIKLRGGL